MSWEYVMEDGEERFALPEMSTYLWYSANSKDGPHMFYISDSYGYDCMSVSLETLQLAARLAAEKVKQLSSS